MYDRVNVKKKNKFIQPNKPNNNLSNINPEIFYKLMLII